MKPIEIVELIKKESPQALGTIPDKRAALIVREALTLLAKNVDALEEGVVKVPGFGTFNVRQVTQKKDGGEAKVKKVIFNPAKGKPAKD